MKKYELLLVLPGTLDDQEAAKRSQEVLAMVKEQSGGAELTTLGKNRLAYPVKQIRYGYFYTVIFEADPAQLKAIQEKLGLARDLLRALISYFKTNLTAAQKIVYATDAAGMTVMHESDEAASTAHRAAPSKEIDLKDIDKKLDEILGGGDIIP